MAFLFDPGSVEHKPAAKPGTPEASLDKYLSRTIRRVTLFFPQAEYDGILLAAKRVMAATGTTNHSDLFERLVRERDRLIQTTVASERQAE